MRLIDADAVIVAIAQEMLNDAMYGEWAGTASTDIEDWEELAEDIIKDIPTIDAVEVVRCKDCVHRNEDSWCRLMCEYMPNNGFCSRGGQKR
jgi:hypothetical protein